MKLIRTNRINNQELLVDESIFALQNGLIGVRGQFSEGYGDKDVKQTLVNGFYNYYDYKYEENSPMFPQKGQRIINIVDGQSIELLINNKKIDKQHCQITQMKRTFLLNKGLTERIIDYKTDDGIIIRLQEERLTSLQEKTLFTTRLTISSPNYNGPMRILSKLVLPNHQNGIRTDSRINRATERELVIIDRFEDSEGVSLLTESTTSNLMLGVAMAHNQPMIYYFHEQGFEGYQDISLEQPYILEKHVSYVPQMMSDQVIKTAQAVVARAKHSGFDSYVKQQTSLLKQFWRSSSIDISGNQALDQMVKYNMYQLFASGVDDSHFSIPAKGLTGEGYEGHYFWDTEVYMIPFFTLTNPEMAKTLLLYRYHHFKEAKQLAFNHGIQKGVKIPWRTINGDEVSPYFLAGSAQYHINSDVAYAVIKYYQWTHDHQFMIDVGYEMLIETGRFLLSSGHYYKGLFNLNGVTGPDEYTVMVDNNFYTNAMAKYHFEKIVDYYPLFKDSLDDLNAQEIQAFKDAARKMKLSYDAKLKVFPQDDTFMQKKPFDFTKVPKEQLPMLLHFHPLFIYRHQILKQADVLLALILLGMNEHEVLKHNFDFYLPKTTHDSSLSKCIHSIVAFRLKDSKIGYQYLEDIAKLDLENTQNNTDHGLHIANSGGIYMSLVTGILGLFYNDSHLTISPFKPQQMAAISFKIIYQNQIIQFQLDDMIHISVEKPIQLGIYNDIINIVDDYHCMYK